jgi:hypothetical protein
MVRGASSSPPTSPAHTPALPCPHRNGHHRGNDGGEERLLTPTINRTVAIFDLLAAAPGLPITAPSATTTAAATAAATSNDDVNESLELDVVPNHYVCSITKMIMMDPVSDAFGHGYEKTVIELWLSKHSTSPVTGVQLPNKTFSLNHALRNIIQDFHSCAATAATATAANASIVSTNAAAFLEEVGSVQTILSDALSRLNSGSRKKKKALKSAHSQAELDLLAAAVAS